MCLFAFSPSRECDVNAAYWCVQVHGPAALAVKVVVTFGDFNACTDSVHQHQIGRADSLAQVV